jgi:hypothetical protein
MAFYWCILTLESYLGYFMLGAPVDGINHVLTQLITHGRFYLDPIPGHPFTRAADFLVSLPNVTSSYGPFGIIKLKFKYDFPEIYDIAQYINPDPERPW